MNRCVTCGHNFYDGNPFADGRCKYCHEEHKDKCVICGNEAGCRGFLGYLCNDPICEREDTIAQYRQDLIDEDEFDNR